MSRLRCILCRRVFRSVPAYLGHGCCQNGRPE